MFRLIFDTPQMMEEWTDGWVRAIDASHRDLRSVAHDNDSPFEEVPDTMRVTKQIDALYGIAKEPGSIVRLTHERNGHFAASVGHGSSTKRIDIRVIERLLQLGDIKIIEDRDNPNRAPRMYLGLTAQGWKRVEAIPARKK